MRFIPNLLVASAMMAVGLTTLAVPARALAEECPEKLKCPDGADVVEKREQFGQSRTCTRKADGKPHGPQVVCVGEALAERGQHEDGKKVGKWISYYHQDGKIGTIANYRDDKLHGDWQQRAGGRVTTGKYVDGVIDGEWTVVTDAGIQVAKTHYNEGIIDGEQKLWFADGQLQWRREYDNGKKTGEWLQYNEAGELLRRSTWEDDREVERCLPDESGDMKCRQGVDWKHWSHSGCSLADGANNEEIIHNQDEFEAVLNCSSPQSIDWEKYRLWVTGVTVSSIHQMHIMDVRPGDNGVEVVFEHSFGCSGMAPLQSEEVRGVLLEKGDAEVLSVAAPTERRDCPPLP